MRHRYCMPLVAFLLVVVPATAADPIKIRWHGQSMFEVETPKGTKIVLDPHVIPAYGMKKLTADLILLSHPHDDHTRVEAIENAKKAKVFEAVLTQKDGPRVQQEWKILDEKFKDVRIQTIGAYHDEVGGMDRGKNGIFVLEIEGVRIAHLGDLGHQLSESQLKKLGKIDVLMIPVGGVYTLNGIGAYKVIQAVKPKRFVVPMHYGTEVYTDLLDGKYLIDEYNDAEKGKLIKKTPLTNELRIDPEGPLPEEAVVLFLGYRGKQ